MPTDTSILAQNAPEMHLAAGLRQGPLGEITASAPPASYF